MKFIIDGTAEVVTQPARFKILQALRTAGPMFVEQIAKETGVHPRMVSHHIDVLQEQKLIESKYELVELDGSKRRVAVRKCWATAHAEEVLKDIAESTKEVI
jgi:predicted ArsR family transcriptional regulator